MQDQKLEDPEKMKERKMQDWKGREQMSGVENSASEPENAGPENKDRKMEDQLPASWLLNGNYEIIMFMRVLCSGN